MHPSNHQSLCSPPYEINRQPQLTTPSYAAQSSRLCPASPCGSLTHRCPHRRLCRRPCLGGWGGVEDWCVCFCLGIGGFRGFKMFIIFGVLYMLFWNIRCLARKVSKPWECGDGMLRGILWLRGRSYPRVSSARARIRAPLCDDHVHYTALAPVKYARPDSILACSDSWASSTQARAKLLCDIVSFFLFRLVGKKN